MPGSNAEEGKEGEAGYGQPIGVGVGIGIGIEHICQNRNNCDSDAGKPFNLLKSQLRMLSVFTFCDGITFEARW
jgi:hypothetical protein